MDTKFKSSFIPKASFGSEAEEHQSFGLISGLAVLLFILSIVSIGGGFFYKMSIKNEVENLQSQLASAEASIDKDSIKEVMLFDRRIKSIKEIIRNHVVASQYFEMLQESTVSQIHFTNLKYSFMPGGNISISMAGKAPTYASIALQEDIFLKNQNTVKANFQGLKADAKDGKVTFDLMAEFKGDLVKFKLPEEVSSETPTTSDSSDDFSDVIDDLNDLPDIGDI